MGGSVTSPEGELTDTHLTTSRPTLEVRHLGVVPYAEANDLQRTLVADRQASRISDLLLLLEHPHVITLGASARRSTANVLASAEELVRRGVQLHEARRGGDVTYHGPGQLVGYPILDLKPDRCDAHRYVRDLEEVIIRTASEFGVTATRRSGLTGVWANGGEACGHRSPPLTVGHQSRVRRQRGHRSRLLQVDPPVWHQRLRDYLADGPDRPTG